MDECRLLEDETAKLLEWCRDALASATDKFAASRRIAPRLGAHPSRHGAAFGFWIPGSQETPSRPILEIFSPTAPLDFSLPSQTVQFRRTRLPLHGVGEFWWGAVAGLTPGTAKRSGDFYWVRGAGPGGLTRDSLAHSLPFGSFAPAEFYDPQTIQSLRRDRGYFEGLAGGGPDGVPDAPRIDPPCNILEIHVETATRQGTLAALTDDIKAIASGISSGRPLYPSERLFCQYEAFELLPLEPVAEPLQPPPWRWLDELDEEGGVRVDLRRPEICNWGYDTLIAGFPAVSPTLLAGRRPDELVDLAATLHNFPTGPIKLILDVVFGHAHRQAEDLLDPIFFAGLNRYGLNLNYRHPTVRALLLEMLRRKLNWGVDGVRVDASQDILFTDEEGKGRVHDDEFLELMGDTVVEAASVRYRPCMIFEDGRPWPRPDWKLTASYRDVIRRQPEALQWSPLTFSSNEPLQPTFWIDKRWRLEETARNGSHWITGVSNHDTLRHATRLDPALAAGWETPRRAFRTTYNNPAASLLFIGFLPGVPMDFLNASREGAWTFVRNSDDHRLKTLCGEVGALDWLVEEHDYNTGGNFERLKALGFSDLAELRRFAWALTRSAQLADDDLAGISQHLALIQLPATNPVEPPELVRFSEDWMLDWRDYSRGQSGDPVEAAKAAFFHRLRQFRRANPWLRDNLAPADVFERNDRHASSVVYQGSRSSPDGALSVHLMVHLAGDPISLQLQDRLVQANPPDCQLKTPGLSLNHSGWPSALTAGQGFLLTERHPA